TSESWERLPAAVPRPYGDRKSRTRDVYSWPFHRRARVGKRRAQLNREYQPFGVGGSVPPSARVFIFSGVLVNVAVRDACPSHAPHRRACACRSRSSVVGPMFASELV